MKYKTFKYKKYKNCYFEVGNYAYNRQSMYIQIKNDAEGDIATATVNMSNYMYYPETVTIKNYGENTGMTNFLFKLGILTDVYSKRKCNLYAPDNETIDYCQVDVDKLKEYSARFEYDYEI